MTELEKTIETYDVDVDRYLTKLEFPTPEEDLGKFIALLTGKRILDAGCGAGRDSKYFVDNGYDVIGIDMSEGMLEAARKRTRAKFLLGDVRRTEFRDSFDGVWCYNTLLHLDESDFKSALNEFYRLLVDDGVLYIATLEGEEGKFAKRSEKGVKYFYPYTREHTKSMIEDLNFELIDVKPYQRKDQNFIDYIVKK